MKHRKISEREKVLSETVDRWAPIIRALANHLDAGVAIVPNGPVHQMLIKLRQLDEDE